MAIDFKSPNAKRWIIAGITLLSLVAYCAPPGTFRRIDFELTGTVRDTETKEPLEGAYVVATYEILETSFAANAIKCKKTRGMYTGKDGKFHFPVEKLDGMNPSDVTAIKPGYYGNDRVFATPQAYSAQGAEAYTNRDHYLTKQDPDKPNFRFGDFQEGCKSAEYREDVEASVVFRKIMLAEAMRLGAPMQLIENFKRGIGDVEDLPSKPKKQ